MRMSSQSPPLVSAVPFDPASSSVAHAIELCNGFASLQPTHKVLIKPNLVTWEAQPPMPPYGVVTTTRVVEELIQLLIAKGCRDITIGEGSVTMHQGAGTMDIFDALGYSQLAKKYGVKLLDFNQSPPQAVHIPTGQTIFLAKDALGWDFFIDVPTLKTHSQTKVSLGMKNLKGCLKVTSKKQFHDPKYGLSNWIQWLPEFISPHLTVIDGILTFVVERETTQTAS